MKGLAALFVALLVPTLALADITGKPRVIDACRPSTERRPSAPGIRECLTVAGIRTALLLRTFFFFVLRGSKLFEFDQTFLLD